MTSQTYFKQLTILMGAMIGGVILFLLVVSFLISSEGAISPSLHDVFQYMGPVIGFGGMIGSSFLYKARLKSIPPEASLESKMAGFRSAKILSFALLDGGALVNALGYLMTGHWVYLAVAGFVLLVFLLGRPTPQQAVNDMELMGEEANRVQNPDAIIASAQQQ